MDVLPFGMGDNAILNRLKRKAGVPGLAAILADRLDPTDLQSLLLEVYDRLAQKRSPAEVLAEFENDRFVGPSAVSPRRLSAWDAVLFAELPPDIEPVALSPVCPLGTNSAVAAVRQNWAVATARNNEVVSNATNVLALACAQRRKALLKRNPKSPKPVHLAASHRLLRPQRYGDAHASAHFALFALCSSGRGKGELVFETEALVLHLGVLLRSLYAFLGADLRLQLDLTDFNAFDRNQQLEAELLNHLRKAFPDLEVGFDGSREAGRGYYQDLCFHIHGFTPSGRRVQLADGSVVDWTQRLLSNAKERQVISGVGSELVCGAFAA